MLVNAARPRGVYMIRAAPRRYRFTGGARGLRPVGAVVCPVWSGTGQGDRSGSISSLLKFKTLKYITEGRDMEPNAAPTANMKYEY